MPDIDRLAPGPMDDWQFNRAYVDELWAAIRSLTADLEHARDMCARPTGVCLNAKDDPMEQGK